jgi:hypothetical protein
MATLTAAVFQNPYLPPGGTDVHAIVSVTCSGAGPAGSAGSAAEAIIVDCSGSMQGEKIHAAARAASVAVDEIIDGTLFSIICGTNTARILYPEPQRGRMIAAHTDTRAAAKQALHHLTAAGGTAIGTWIELARASFAAAGAVQQHALLLTDGKDESESHDDLRRAVEGAKGVFQCDCRGVGDDWVVDELRYVASELLGQVDLIAQPEEMEADFKKVMQSAMGRGVPGVNLQMWAPQGSEVLFVRQVSPTIDDLTGRRIEVDALTGAYPTGSWGDESRDYHVAVRVPTQPTGADRLAARVKLVGLDGAVLVQGLVKAVWSDDDTLTTRIDPHVASYTGQAELAAVIQEGLAAKAAGDDPTATAKLGRAVQLAASTGNEEATNRLRKVVDIDNAETGTVRLRRDASKLDEMALDTASTRTTRVRS